jgi:hypothetical protein
MSLDPRNVQIRCMSCGNEWTEDKYSIPELQQYVHDKVVGCPLCHGSHVLLQVQLTDEESDMLLVTRDGFGHVVPYHQIGGPMEEEDDENCWSGRLSTINRNSDFDCG